ncbi:ankyrin [Penicillium canescens]|nr:ankyrin [Penicillium canescens]KAJ6182075.1 ankyrin [Penicillium canescens]
MASNRQDRKVALLQSSADLSDVLCRYSFFEVYYRETESEASEGIRRAIVRVYTAILRYVLAAIKFQAASVGRNIIYDLTGSAVEQLRELKSTVSNEDVNFEKWTHVTSLLRHKESEILLKQIHEQALKGDAKDKTQEREKFLHWIYKYPLYGRLNDLTSKRYKKEVIGRWFVTSNELSDWKAGKPKALHCYGIPSAGKTMLMAATIEHLDRDHPDTPLAFVFCDYKSEDRQTFPLLIASMLKQLLERCPDYQSPLFAQYQKNTERDPQPRELLKDFENLIEKQEKVFILLDALDELQQGVRHELLKQLCAFGESYKSLHILTTCRPGTVEYQPSPAYHLLEIQPREEDIRLYIENSIDNPLLDRNWELRTKIVTKILNAAKGIYLIPKIQTSIINQLPTNKRLVARFRCLPTEDDSLDSTYKDAMERIAQEETSQIDAHRLLAWLVQAKRPLHSTELLIALSIGDLDEVQPSATEISLEPYARSDASSDASSETSLANPITQQDLKQIIASCVGMVDYDEKEDVVRLAHETTNDFLRKHASKQHDVPLKEGTSLKENDGLFRIDPKEYVALTCITYLNKYDSMKEDVRGISTRYMLMDQNTLLDYMAFLDYTARYFGSHVEDVGTESETLKPQLKKLLEKDSAGDSDRFLISLYQQNAIRQALRNWKGKEVEPELYDCSHRDETSMRLDSVQRMVLLGLPSLLDQFLDQPHRSLDDFEEGDSPLNYAAQISRLQEAKVLLKHGAAINAIGRGGRAPIHAACRFGSLEMVEWLVEMGADVNLPEGDGEETPLHIASYHDRDDVLDFLLSNGGSVNYGPAHRPRNTALRNALDLDRDRCRRLLLFDKKCFTRENVAGLDIPMESSGLVRELLESYVSPHQSFGQGQGCLDVALLQRDSDLVQFCLEKEACPKLFWTTDSDEITFHQDEPFYDTLVAQITALNPPLFSKKRVEQVQFDCERYDTEQRELEPYLEVQIPKGSPPPDKIIFTIVSRDQGWSSFQYDKGAYNSLTWFEAGIADCSPNGMVEPLEMQHPIICQNKHAWKNWTTQIVSWDRHDTSPDIQDWFDALIPGRVIRVFPRVVWSAGWSNYVKSVVVDVFA